MARGLTAPIRIGVTTARRGGRTTWSFNRLALWRAGATAVRVSPAHRRSVELLDGLVIGGGDDIGVELYRSEVVPTVAIDVERDRLELELVGYATEKGLPLLGICRGAQMINVALGGTLHADIYDIYVDAPRLRTVLPRKTVILEEGSRLRRIIGRATCRVNALHHQSIDRLAAGLRIVARDRWRIVQGIEAADDRFIIGVQWHPEFLPYSRGQMALFEALVAAAREARGAARGRIGEMPAPTR